MALFSAVDMSDVASMRARRWWMVERGSPSARSSVAQPACAFARWGYHRTMRLQRESVESAPGPSPPHPSHDPSRSRCRGSPCPSAVGRCPARPGVAAEPAPDRRRDGWEDETYYFRGERLVHGQLEQPNRIGTALQPDAIFVYRRGRGIPSRRRCKPECPYIGRCPIPRPTHLLPGTSPRIGRLRRDDPNKHHIVKTFTIPAPQAPKSA
jgi:hypothetical protein